MKSALLSESEVILLEAVQALGGDAHVSEIKGAIRWQVRQSTHKALAALQQRGLLHRYARGCYALSPEGRHALTTTGRGGTAQWLSQPSVENVP